MSDGMTSPPTRLVAHPASVLLATDYDGTLAPIVDDPTAAVAAPGVAATLARLADDLAGVVVVTGRDAGETVRLGGLAAVPRLVVLGHYGEQRWQDGALRTLVEPPDLGAARAELAALLQELLEGSPEAMAGVAVEDKGTSLAVHTRRAADPEAALVLVAQGVDRLAARLGLHALRGRLVVELRNDASDKGQALLAHLGEWPRVDTVVVIGDDLGDLPTFEAARTWQRAGQQAGQSRLALVVGVANAESPAVAEAADLVLPDVPGVLQFLTAWADGIGERSA